MPLQFVAKDLTWELNRVSSILSPKQVLQRGLLPDHLQHNRLSSVFAHISKTHFVLHLQNTNTTSKTGALKGWQHLNLEIENKYNQRQSNTKLPLNMKPKYTVYTSPATGKALLFKNVSSFQSHFSFSFFQWSPPWWVKGWRGLFIRRNPKSHHPFPDSSLLALGEPGLRC